jgi:hypothetical protein
VANPLSASVAAKLTAVVVFATPPLKFMNEILAAFGIWNTSTSYRTLDLISFFIILAKVLERRG